MAFNFSVCYNYLRMLQRRRCSGSNSTHRCSSSDTNSRHWTRCSNYPPRRGACSTFYPLRRSGEGGRLAAARFRFFTLCGLRAAQGAISVRRPPFHRVSYQPDHRKRQRRRRSGTNPTLRRTRTDTNSRHRTRGPNYPPRRG